MNLRFSLCISITLALCSASAVYGATTTIVPSAQNTALELKSILKDLLAVNPKMPVKQAIAHLNNSDAFTETELIELGEKALKKAAKLEGLQDSPAYEALQAFLQNTTHQLKDYKISGIGFTHHPSVALIASKQNFDTDFQFKNSNGDVITRTFNLQYNSVGYQAELVYRFDTIFAVNADLSSFTMGTPLELGVGFTGGWRLPLPSLPSYRFEFPTQTGRAYRVANPIFPFSVLGFTILPFKKMKGYLVIAHYGLLITGIVPLNGDFPLSWQSFNAALVLSGGTIKPAVKTK